MTPRLLILAATLAAAACSRGDETSATKEAWNNLNAPQIFGVQSSRFDSVPTQASLPNGRQGWSGDYWATYQGGISYRWQINNGGSQNWQDYLYQPLAPNQAQSLSSAQLNQLSPAEKYDLYVGRTDFPLTRSEQASMQSTAQQNGGRIPSWNGICHGWAAAATSEPQPGRVARVQLRDGRSLDFTNGDLQALISRAYSDFSTYQYAFIGGRCDSQSIQADQWGRPLDPACRDVNPGTFHLVLGEYIARRQQGFIADVQNDEQVWNQPVSGYRLSYSNLRPYTGQDGSGSFRAPGTAQLVDVIVQLDYVAETNPSATAHGNSFDSLRVSYQLELDRNGYVIGGEWTSKDRPDFLWQVRSTPDTRASGVIDYNVVKALLQQSLGSDPGPGPTPNPGPQPFPQPGVVSVTVDSFRLVDDIGLRPLAMAAGSVQGNGAAYVQLDAIFNDGSQRTLARTTLDASRRFLLRGRVIGARVFEFRLRVLDGNQRAIAERSLGSG